MKLAQGDFIEILARQRPVILDGATGTWLQNQGLPAGTGPDLWAVRNPDILRSLQSAYLEAGSDIIYAFTFGANRIKLAENKIPVSDVTEINRELASISCQARDDFCRSHSGRQVYVAGDLAPVGKFLYPAGELLFCDLIAIYQEQAAALVRAGVDLFVIETMMDLAQVRAAIIAIRNVSGLPIMATVTLESNGRTLSGNGPLECLLSLTDLGISAFGINCSHGPAIMRQWLAPLLEISPLPLIAKPNAGLPELREGKTVFSMNESDFAAEMQLLAKAGVRILGGCCGTGPGYIAQMKRSTVQEINVPAQSWPPALPEAICSSRKTWFVDREQLERLPAVAAASAAGLVEEILDLDIDDAPALIIDFRPWEKTDILEGDALGSALQELQVYSEIPLIFRGDDVRILDVLLYNYHGRAGIITEANLTRQKGLSL